MPSGLENNSHEELKKILLENNRLLVENNQMLYRMRRSAALSGVLRFLWFIILISLSVYVYFNYIKPNLGYLEQKLADLERLSEDSAQFQEWYAETKSKIGAE